jgi:hypothetical protein
LHCGFPFALDFFVTKSTEAHTPAFENDHLNRRLALTVADLPLACRESVSRASESRLVIRRDLDIALAVRDSCKCLDTELYVVCRRLATMLNKRIAGLGFRECFLFFVWKVEVVYRENQGGQVVWCRGEGLGESGDLPCLSAEAWDNIVRTCTSSISRTCDA